MADIKIIIGPRGFRIYIDVLLHVHIMHNAYVGMRSHKQDIFQEDLEYKEYGKIKYVITLFTTGPNIVCEYKEKQLWEDILTLLAQNL